MISDCTYLTAHFLSSLTDLHTCSVQQDLPLLLRDFLEELAEISGWSWSIMGGGPAVEDGGNIASITSVIYSHMITQIHQFVLSSWHVGRTAAGATFKQTQPEFNAQYASLYGSFLNDVYRAFGIYVAAEIH